MDKKTVILVGILILGIVGIGYWSVSDARRKNEETARKIAENPASKISQDSNADIILFYGTECPHCQDVNEFIEKNQIGEKVSFAHLEIWHDKRNSETFREKVKVCEIPEEELGVPLLIARGKCLIGAPDIEEFFLQEAGLAPVDNSGE